MTRKDAIEAIKCNWPDSRYTILREALDMAVKALEDVTDKNVGKMTNADRIRAMSDKELAELMRSMMDCDSCGNKGDCGYDHFISNAPTIDAVPVVRCEKCVAHGSCFAERVFVYTGIENPYCCAGERKEGADNGS